MFKHVLAILSLLLFTHPATSAVTIEDGAVHIINDTTYQSDLVILDRNIAHDPGTQVDLVTGGEVQSFSAENNSTLNIFSGLVTTTITLKDNANLDISGGTVNSHVTGTQDSHLIVSGGTLDGNIQVNDNATMDISGGTVNQFIAFHNSKARLSGGTVNTSLISRNDATTLIEGGSPGTLLFTAENGRIYVEGTGFTVTDPNGLNPVNVVDGDHLSNFGTFVENGDFDYFGGFLSGTLDDSTIINIAFEIHNSGVTAGTCDIIIGPIPKCGDANHPIPTSDLNEDCIVNILDLAIMAAEWLTDNNPI